MMLPVIAGVLLVCSLLLTACTSDPAPMAAEQSTGGASIHSGGAGGNGGMQPALTGGTVATPASGGSASPEHDAGSTMSSPLDASSSMDGATSDDAASADASGELHPSFVGCRGPNEPGCAVCADGENNFRSRRTTSSETPGFGAFYNSSSIDATCEPVCPLCASCTNAEQRGAEQLGTRPECLPCTGNTGVDPCFDVEGCGCWCALRAVLQEACPTLVP